MPLYEHASGEKVRTVAESPEDDRLREDKSWSLAEGKAAGQAPAAEKPAKSAAARGAVTASGGDDQ